MPYKDPARRAEAIKQTQVKYFGSTEAYLRNTNYLRNYGITLFEYNKLVSAQCGACAICGYVPCEDPDAKTNQKVLHVDHDHETGKIRGLVCSNCNRVIGLFGEEIEMVMRAAQYLKEAI